MLTMGHGETLHVALCFVLFISTLKDEALQECDRHAMEWRRRASDNRINDGTNGGHKEGECRSQVGEHKSKEGGG